MPDQRSAQCVGERERGHGQSCRRRRYVVVGSQYWQQWREDKQLGPDQKHGHPRDGQSGRCTLFHRNRSLVAAPPLRRESEDQACGKPRTRGPMDSWVAAIAALAGGGGRSERGMGSQELSSASVVRDLIAVVVS